MKAKQDEEERIRKVVDSTAAVTTPAAAAAAAAAAHVVASVSSGADTSPSTKASNKADYATENKELTTKIAQMMTACKKAADEGMDVLDNYDHAMEEGVAQGKLDSMLKELVNHEAECSRLNAQFSDELRKHEALDAPADFLGPLRQFLEDREHERSEMMDELKKVPTNKESGSDKPVGDAATTPIAASVSSGADTSPSTKASNKADYATENKELTTKIAQMMTACKKAADEGMDVLDNYDHAMEEGVAQGKLDSMLKELVNHEAECSRLNAQFSDELRKHEALDAPADFLGPLRQFLEDREHERSEMMDELKKAQTQRETPSRSESQITTISPKQLAKIISAEEYSTVNKEMMDKISTLKKECKDAADDGMDILDEYDEAVEKNASRQEQEKLLEELVHCEEDLKRHNHDLLLELKRHISNGAPGDFINPLRTFLRDREHERKDIVDAIAEAEGWGMYGSSERDRAGDDGTIESDLASEASDYDEGSSSRVHTGNSCRSRSGTARKPPSRGDKLPTAQRTFMDSRGRPTTEGGGAVPPYPIREKGDSKPSTPSEGWASASDKTRSEWSRPSTLGTDSRPNTYGSGVSAGGNIPIILDGNAESDVDGSKDAEGGKISWAIKGRARDEGGLGETSPRAD